MGKKGTEGRRSSGIIPTQVMNELGKNGFVLVTVIEQPPILSAYREQAATTKERLNAFIPAKLRAEGHQAVTSSTGEYVIMFRSSDGVSERLQVNEHITPSVLKAKIKKLDQLGFALVTATETESPSTAFRKTVTATKIKMQAFIDPALRKIGHQAVTSRTGDSVRMHRVLDGVSVLLPVEDHITDNALSAIQSKTGVQLSQLQQLQHKRIL